jgi:plasmid maintenance system antidote protein VapI
VPANRIGRIIAGKRGVTANTTLRRARHFGATPEFWTILKKAYELALAVAEIGDVLARLPQRSAPRMAARGD